MTVETLAEQVTRLENVEAMLARDSEKLRADLSPQWQPIETAPKDGTWVLIWCGWVGHPRSSAFEHGSWQNLPWVANSKDYNPTHWMPLPAPPAE